MAAPGTPSRPLLRGVLRGRQTLIADLRGGEGAIEADIEVACAGDPALRQRVEALLRSQANPASFTESPTLNCPT